MKDNNGTVLIIVILLLTILTGITVEFAYSVYVNTSALTNWINAQRSSLLNRTAQNLTLNYINEIRKKPLYLNTEVTLPFSLYTGGDENVSIRVEDENAKLNINSIIYQNGRTDENALSSLKRLFKNLDVDITLADRIADWIDPDIEPRLGGSETGTKNTYLWSIDELRLIDGIDERVFNTIKPFITIYSNGKININTAQVPVLMSLHDEMTESLAEKVIYYRQNTPFNQPSDITKVSGLEGIGITIDRITTDGSCYRVITKATVNDITRSIEGVMDISGKVLYWKEG